VVTAVFAPSIAAQVFPDCHFPFDALPLATAGALSRQLPHCATSLSVQAHALLRVSLQGARSLRVERPGANAPNPPDQLAQARQGELE
jgi:hypothetical protein